jgi:DNA-binding response OmpR family regulator
MRILLAEDDVVSRRALELTLQRWGYEVTAVGDGTAAWRVLQQEPAPPLALIDWMMPGLDGVEVCSKARARTGAAATYLILISAKSSTDDVVAGLESGADDYITKPIDLPELQARLRVGTRLVELQQSLADRVCELDDALHRVKQLQGLLPICSYCKKIRDDHNYWQQVESYISAHTDARFSHSICPECYEKVVKPDLERLQATEPDMRSE